MSAIRRLTVSKVPMMKGRTPHELVIGNTPDISVYSKFSWYEVVYYLDNDGEQKVAHWIGHSENHGSGNCYWLLPESCKPIVRSTVWSIPEMEKTSDGTRSLILNLKEEVNKRIGDKSVDSENYPVEVGIFEGEEDEERNIAPQDPQADIVGGEEFTPDSFEKYLSTEVMLPKNGQLHRGTVRKRVLSENGDPVGLANENPLLDTREYVVEFQDGGT